MNETEIIRLVTQAVRDADDQFESVGGSTRHWVRECFLPALERVGLTIAPSNPGVQPTAELPGLESFVDKSKEERQPAAADA